MIRSMIVKIFKIIKTEFHCNGIAVEVNSIGVFRIPCQTYKMELFGNFANGLPPSTVFLDV